MLNFFFEYLFFHFSKNCDRTESFCHFGYFCIYNLIHLYKDLVFDLILLNTVVLGHNLQGIHLKQLHLFASSYAGNLDFVTFSR